MASEARVGPVRRFQLWAIGRLRRSRFLPLTYAVSLLRGIWRGDGWINHAGDVAALAIVLFVCMALASKVFRWE